MTARDGYAPPDEFDAEVRERSLHAWPTTDRGVATALAGAASAAALLVRRARR